LSAAISPMLFVTVHDNDQGPRPTAAGVDSGGSHSCQAKTMIRKYHAKGTFVNVHLLS